MDKTLLDQGTFLWHVQQGIQGFNKGFDNGMALNNYTYGTQRSRYYLIGADSGVGKTTLVDEYFCLKPLVHAATQGIPVEIIYYSFEIPAIDKEAKWLSWLIYSEEGIELSPDYILGRLYPRVPDHAEVDLIVKYKGVLDALTKDRLHLHDEPLNPTGIYMQLFEHFKKNGTVKYTKYLDTKEGKWKEKISGYVPKDPRKITVCVIDHVALASLEKGYDLKRNIDQLSTYMVYFRNRFGLTPVLIQQFNTDMGSAIRQKLTPAAIAPDRLDFGDSKYTYRDADVVLGLIRPTNFGLSEYGGIDLSDTTFADYFVMLHLMKNRYGPDNKALPLQIHPVVGAFEDIKLDTMDVSELRAQQISQTCQSYCLHKS